MKNFFKVLGVIALVAVIGFSMAACGSYDDDSGGGGGGGSPGSGGLSGTWVSEWTGNAITFSGSNYTIVDEDGTEVSSGTYTVDDGVIAYNQTTPTSATKEGYYFPDHDPPYLNGPDGTRYYK